jgi:hypothetical protein
MNRRTVLLKLGLRDIFLGSDVRSCQPTAKSRRSANHQERPFTATSAEITASNPAADTSLG